MLLDRRIPLTYLFKQARGGILVVVAIATGADVLVAYGSAHVPPVPATIPAFLGTAISLLLSFRLSQSYDRWWEGRKVWGAIVNDSRTLVRQVLAFAGRESELPERIARRQIAWCYCLGQSLRGLDWRERTTEHLSDEDLDEVEGYTNKPVALLQMHARDVARMAKEGILTEYRAVAIDGTLTGLTNSMGMAERIRSTVFPRTYGIFLHAFIYLFITSLAIALAELEGFWAISITTVIALPFLLLERTALHMQDPFSDRPTDAAMTTIARVVEINIREMLGDEDVPGPLPPEDYFAR